MCLKYNSRQSAMRLVLLFESIVVIVNKTNVAHDVPFVKYYFMDETTFVVGARAMPGIGPKTSGGKPAFQTVIDWLARLPRGPYSLGGY